MAILVEGELRSGGHSHPGFRAGDALGATSLFLGGRQMAARQMRGLSVWAVRVVSVVWGVSVWAVWAVRDVRAMTARGCAGAFWDGMRCCLLPTLCCGRRAHDVVALTGGTLAVVSYLSIAQGLRLGSVPSKVRFTLMPQCRGNTAQHSMA